MILRQRSGRFRGLPGLETLLLVGAVLLLRPPGATAQASGTMRVSARVHRAPAAWPALAAAADLATRAAGNATSPSRVDLELVRLTVEDHASDRRRLRLRIDYLRN